MAVHFAAGLNYAQRTAGGFLNPAGLSTVMMWVRFGTIQANPNYNLAYALLDDPAVYTQYVTIQAVTFDNINLTITGAGINSTSFTPVAGQWYHLCWIQSVPAPGSSGQLFYVNGTKIGSTAFVNRGAWVIGYEMIGNDTFATSDIDVQYFRSWQSQLTTEEIRTEMQSATAVKATPFMNTPLTSNLNDISGNGRNWTLVGADSFVTGPSFPANSTAATAVEISGLPTSVTTDFLDGMYAWYTYNSIPADLAAGFLARSNLTDQLTVLRYTGSPSSLTLFNSDADIINTPFILPTAGGETWYFRVFSNPTQPTDDVVIDGQLPPDEEVPIGAIGVNDDGNFTTDGDIAPPATFISGVNGTTLRFALAAVGEAGTVLPTTGQICLHDVLTDTANIYDPELGTPTATVASGSVISTDYTTQFYIASTGLGGVVTLSPAGVLGSTVFAIGAAAVMTPNRDNTILYYATGANGAAVKRWNLTTNVAMADFAAGVANHRIVNDMLCLSDGSIIVGYDKPSAATDWFVRRYNAAGSILNTYTFGATNRVNRMAMAIADPDSFWVWLYLDDDPGTPYGGTTSRFVEVQASDGTILNTVEAVNWEAGVNRSEPSADPLRFGHSFSCPFWIQRVGVTPTPDVNVREYLIRRERWFPVMTKEQHRITAHLLQLYFEAGTGITDGQGSDPICELDWSDDGGHTWSNLHLIKTGKIGEYKRRAIKRMMGQFRERVYRVAVSDPVQWSLIDSFFNATEGTS